MKPILLAAAFVLAMAPVACVTTQEDLLYMNDQIVALNKQVQDLEKTTEKRLSIDLDARLAAIHESQGDVRAELDRIRKDLQRISGKVEDHTLLIKHIGERDTTEQDALTMKLAELDRRVESLEAEIQRLSGRPGVAPKKRQPATPSTSPTRKPTPRPSPTPTPLSAEQKAYDRALAAYRKGRYEEAIGHFKTFVKTYSKSDLSDNAQFWVGESYMALKQYEQAILAYQEVIKKYPRGNKVPGAMLRQAVAFHEIKDDISAKLLLRKVIKQYPKSSEAAIARKKLKTLK